VETKHKHIIAISSLFILSLLLFFLSYGKSTDVVVDFYQSFYIADLVAQGYLPYIDYSFFFGAFPVYFHALLILVFGKAFVVNYIVSLVIILLSCFLFYALVFKSTRSAWTSFVGGLLFLALHAFQDARWFSGFNFITPYNYASIYSSFFILGILYFYNSRVFLTSLLIALTLLSRIEYGCLIAFILIFFTAHPLTWRQRFLYFCVLPGLVTLGVYSYFLLKMGVRDFLFGNILWIPHLPFGHQNIFNKSILGISFFSLGRTLVALFLFCSLLFLNLSNRWRQIFAYLSFLLIVLFIPWQIREDQLLSYIPFVNLVLFAALSIKDRRAFKLPLFLLAQLFIARIYFNCKLDSYFFYMGIFSILFCICAVAEVLRLQTMVYKKYFFAFIAIYVSCFVVWQTQQVYRYKTVEFKTPYGNMMFSDLSFFHSIVQVKRFLDENRKINETIQALPEGPIFNYIYNTPQPLRYNHINPVGYFFYGPEKIIHDLEKSMPSYIILFYQFGEYFDPYVLFMEDYGGEVKNWMKDHYVLLEKINGGTTDRHCVACGGAEIWASRETAKRFGEESGYPKDYYVKGSEKFKVIRSQENILIFEKE